MKLSIRNFRGIASADIDLDGLVLVGGPNSSGKSSIALAARALGTGNPTPIDGVQKSSAGLFVRAGNAAGQISLTKGEADTVGIGYPKAAVTSEGVPPQASPYAVGARDFIKLTVKEKSAALIEYLKASPTRADIAAIMGKLGFADDHKTDDKGAAIPNAVDRLWSKITDNGWDNAHAHAKETGQKLKGQWEAVTGEHYGSSKAENWLPKDWETDLEGQSEDSLQSMVSQARAFVEAGVAATAITEAERTKLELLAGDLPSKTKYVETLRADLGEQNEALGEMKKRREQLPKPGAEQKKLICAHCGCENVLEGGELVAASELSPADNEARRIRLKAHDDDQAKQVARVDDLRRQLDRALHNVAEAEAAKKKLAEFGQTPAQNEADLDAARQQAAAAEKRLTAFTAKTRADSIADSIAKNQAIVAALAADGLRLAKLKAAILEFNSGLKIWSENAGWDKVEIGTADLSVTLGGKPLMLDDSEAYRARVTLQLALAALDGSDFAVIDAADILDRAGRNGLVKLALAFGKPVLVTMTLNRPDEMPPLTARGLGRCYWLENGEAHAA